MMGGKFTLRGAGAPTAASMHTSASGDAHAVEVRTESDAFGNIEVEASKYWGAQTQRSLQNFPIGGRESRMPIEVIKGASKY